MRHEFRSVQKKALLAVVLVLSAGPIIAQSQTIPAEYSPQGAVSSPAYGLPADYAPSLLASPQGPPHYSAAPVTSAPIAPAPIVVAAPPPVVTGYQIPAPRSLFQRDLTPWPFSRPAPVTTMYAPAYGPVATSPGYVAGWQAPQLPGPPRTTYSSGSSTMPMASVPYSAPVQVVDVPAVPIMASPIIVQRPFFVQQPVVTYRPVVTYQPTYLPVAPAPTYLYSRGPLGFPRRDPVWVP